MFEKEIISNVSRKKSNLLNFKNFNVLSLKRIIPIRKLLEFIHIYGVKNENERNRQGKGYTF